MGTIVRMVKELPPPPFKKLADLLVSKQGGGKSRRLRRKVTAAEVAEAVSLLRTYCPDAKLLDAKQSDALCRKVLVAALSPDRKPHPKENWDLVSVYAGLQKIERGEACVELGLTIRVQSKFPPLPSEQKLAQARDLVRLARRQGDAKVVKAAKRFQGLIELELQILQDNNDHPLSSAVPPPLKPKAETEDFGFGDES